MPEEMEVGCARPTGGSVGETIEETPDSLQAIKKEGPPMIQVGKTGSIKTPAKTCSAITAGTGSHGPGSISIWYDGTSFSYCRVIKAPHWAQFFCIHGIPRSWAWVYPH